MITEVETEKKTCRGKTYDVHYTSILNQPEDIHPDSFVINFTYGVESYGSRDRWLVIRDQASLTWLIDTLINHEIGNNRTAEKSNSKAIESLELLRAEALRRIDESRDRIWKERDYSHLQALLTDLRDQCGEIRMPSLRVEEDCLNPSLFEDYSVHRWADFFVLPNTQYCMIAALDDSGGYRADFDALSQKYLPRTQTLIENYSGLTMPGDEELIAFAINAYNYWSDQEGIGCLEDFIADQEDEKLLESGEA